MAKFISYNGAYPCLCFGTLIIEAVGERYELEDILQSGGSVSFDEDLKAIVTQGEWVIRERNLPNEPKSLKWEIEDVVNENVPYGCCGVYLI